MGRFYAEDVDKVGNSGQGGAFFKLENDGDIARVQFLGRDMNDFPGYTVHEVYIGDKRRYVNCLREVGDPIDVCPLCQNRNKQLAKLFIPLFNIDADEVQVWERGKTFFRDLGSYCSRIKDVSEVITEVERKGKAKDPSTTYGLYDVRDKKPVNSLDDFVDAIPEIEGRYVLDKTADEIEYYLDNGDFPDNEAGEVRRRGSNRNERADEPVRRRPSRRSGEEEF